MHYSDESEYIIKSLSFKCSNEYKQLTSLFKNILQCDNNTASPLTSPGVLSRPHHDWPLDTQSAPPLLSLLHSALVSGLQLTLTLTAALVASDQPRMVAGPASSGPGVMSCCEARHPHYSAIWMSTRLEEEGPQQCTITNDFDTLVILVCVSHVWQHLYEQEIIWTSAGDLPPNMQCTVFSV